MPTPLTLYRHRKNLTLILAAAMVPAILFMGAISSFFGGAGGSSLAVCQAAATGGVTGGTTGGTPGGTVTGQLTPEQVEMYWFTANGPQDAMATAGAIADAESDDIPDRLQGSLPSAPETPTANTPTDPSLVGWGLWQITPGSAIYYNPTTNAKEAVAKYDADLQTFGNGFLPWTTYTSGAYTQYLPAAQEAYNYLKTHTTDPNPTGGLGGTNSGGVGGTTTGTTTTPTTANATISTAAANNYLTTLEGNTQVGYAIVSSSGKILAKHKDTLLVDAEQITQAMLLVAYLNAHPTGPLSTTATKDLTAMVEDSKTHAANWVYGQVGSGGVTAVAQQAGMTAFKLEVATTGYKLEPSQVDALDYAKFFAKIDQLIPAGQRTFAMGLLSNLAKDEQWGVLSDGFQSVTASQAGSQPGTDGWTVNQAAQVGDPTYGTLGLAIVSQNDGNANNGDSLGQQIMATVASDLVGDSITTAAGYQIDLSQLTTEEQQQLQQETQLVQTEDPGACSNAGLNTSLPTTPGTIATINSTTGVASAPTGLPASVKPAITALIAAGNQIHTLPYIWGGGHGVNLNTLQAGYDCSGSTSYDLYKAGLLSSPYALVSGEYEKWGAPGPGKYITIFSNSTHVFIEVAGIVMDTAWYSSVAPSKPSSGPRWQPASMIQAQINGDISGGGGGFVETHPVGY